MTGLLARLVARTAVGRARPLAVPSFALRAPVGDAGEGPEFGLDALATGSPPPATRAPAARPSIAEDRPVASAPDRQRVRESEPASTTEPRRQLRADGEPKVGPAQGEAAPPRVTASQPAAAQRVDAADPRAGQRQAGHPVAATPVVGRSATVDGVAAERIVEREVRTNHTREVQHEIRIEPREEHAAVGTATALPERREPAPPLRSQPAPVAAPTLAPRRAPEPTAAPDVHIHIGRVEVRDEPARTPAPTAAPAPAPSMLTLADYLSGRETAR